MIEFLFEGFEPANTTPVPDVFFDVLLPLLSGAETKVLLYIIRRTLGFKKTTDAISLTQFEKGIVTHDGKVLDEGCGLNRETISKALKSLESRGCITSQKRLIGNNHDVTVYSIRFKSDAGVVGKSDPGGSRKIRPGVVGKNDYPSRKNSTGVVGKSDPQETVIQQTVIQENTYIDAAAADVESRTLVFHPEHNFIGFNDLLAPSLMVVRLTPAFPSPYYSELEDKRRGQVVNEVMYYLESRGLHPTLQWTHEPEEETSIPSEPTVLQAEKPEKPSTEKKAGNTTPARKNASKGAKQPMVTENSLLPIAPEEQAPTQEALLNVTPITAKLKAWQVLPEGEPVEPVVTAETVVTPALLVEFVEAQVQRRFRTTLSGKQKIAEREQQFKAASILLNSKLCFEDIKLAYKSEAAWRRDEVTLVSLARPTEDGPMRAIKVLDNLRARSLKDAQKQQETKQQPTVPQQPIVIEKYKPENIAAFHKRIIEEAEAAAKAQVVDDLGLPPPTEEEIALVEAMMREREEARYAAKKRA